MELSAVFSMFSGMAEMLDMGVAIQQKARLIKQLIV